jgi:hypothetical protein
MRRAQVSSNIAVRRLERGILAPVAKRHWPWHHRRSPARATAPPAGPSARGRLDLCGWPTRGWPSAWATCNPEFTVAMTVFHALVEVDANVVPEERSTTLGNYDADPDRGGERGGEHRPVFDLDDPVAALALLGFIGALELDEMRFARTLFAELQATVGHIEVCVPLPDLAVVLGPDLAAYLERAVRVGIERLALDVSPRSLCWIDCDGYSRSARLQHARSHTRFR